AILTANLRKEPASSACVSLHVSTGPGAPLPRANISPVIRMASLAKRRRISPDREAFTMGAPPPYPRPYPRIASRCSGRGPKGTPCQHRRLRLDHRVDGLWG